MKEFKIHQKCFESCYEFEETRIWLYATTDCAFLKILGKAYCLKVNLHAKIFASPFFTSSFSSVLLLESSKYNFFFFISCILVFSLFVSCLSIHRWGIAFFLLHFCVFVWLCSGIMCVQSTIVPLLRAGEHTICESVYTTLKKQRNGTKKKKLRVMVSVLSFKIKCFQYEQLFSRKVHQVEGKINNLLLVDCIFLFRLSLLYWNHN